MEEAPRLTFVIRPAGWAIDGELDHRNTLVLHAWCEEISELHEPRMLDLAGLEIHDSEGIGAAVDAVRKLLQHTPALTILHAPHLLAHTLYRIGMLEPGGRLELVEPRQEEPYG